MLSKLQVSIYLVLLNVLIKNLHTSFAGVIRFCSNENKIEFSSKNCSGGIFEEFSQNAWKWDCVCATGSWIFLNSVCGLNSIKPAIPHLVYNSNHSRLSCIHQSQSIIPRPPKLYSAFLGNAVGLRGSDPVLLTSSHGVVVQPTITKFGYHFGIDAAAQCYQSGGRSRFWIIIVDPAVRWTARLNEDPFALCLLPIDYMETEGADVAPKGIYMYDVSSLCSSREYIADENIFLTLLEECEYENGAEWLDVLPSKVNNSTVDNNVHESCAACAEPPPKLGDNADCAGECTPAEILTENVLEYNMDLQTSRLGMHLLNKVLKHPENQSAIDDFSPYEVKLLTKSAIIALTACDSVLIPKPYYQYFIVMFRALLFESKDYSSRKQISQENQEWIESALTRCRIRTKRYVLPTEDFCTHKTIFLLTKKQGGRLPENVNWNEKLDALLEFIWKLTTFLIYQCFEEFSEGTTYHYELRALLEAMFSEDLLIRWLNPSNSNKMYRHLLEPHLKMEAAMEHFDLCVAAAHKNSRYGDDIWLRRPVELLPSYVKKEMDNTKPKIATVSGQNSLASSQANLSPQEIKCYKNIDEFLSSTSTQMESCWKS